MTKFAFFGTDEFTAIVLETLKDKGLRPELIVTAPDRPKGRKLIITPPPAKFWAQKNRIPFLQPEKLDSSLTSKLRTFNFKLFLVASYGKILPEEIIYLPEYKTLNVHPSLLPRLRGPSPIEETILQDKKPGVTILRIDEKMDHGPIVAQKEIQISPWPISFPELRDILAKEGAKIFSDILPKWLSKEIKEKPQDESLATYTKLLKKEDGLIDLKADPEINFRKFLAYNPWPGVYFFHDEKRIKITEAGLANGKFSIKKVVPEGKNKMSFEEFSKNYHLNL